MHMRGVNCWKLMAAILGAILLIGFSAVAQAQNFNIDFANAADTDTDPLPGPPSSAFGAAASQAGFWNMITSAGPSTLNDLAGSASSAQISVTADNLGGYGGDHSNGDLHSLLDDNFYSSNGASWSFTISGLTDGVYTFYYYAPANSVVDTGTFTVNGIAATSIVGDDGTNTDNSPLTQGLNWEVIQNVTVSGGTLTVISTSTASNRGVAGIQLVLVPEPATTSLIVAGALGLAAFGWRKRKRS